MRKKLSAKEIKQNTIEMVKVVELKQLKDRYDAAKIKAKPVLDKLTEKEKRLFTKYVLSWLERDMFEVNLVDEFKAKEAKRRKRL